MVMYNRPLDTVCVVAVCVLYVANRHTDRDATGRTRVYRTPHAYQPELRSAGVDVPVARSSCGQSSDVLNLNEMKQNVT